MCIVHLSTAAERLSAGGDATESQPQIMGAALSWCQFFLRIAIKVAIFFCENCYYDRSIFVSTAIMIVVFLL